MYHLQQNRGHHPTPGIDNQNTHKESSPGIPRGACLPLPQLTRFPLRDSRSDSSLTQCFHQSGAYAHLGELPCPFPSGLDGHYSWQMSNRHNQLQLLCPFPYVISYPLSFPVELWKRYHRSLGEEASAFDT